jgi:hypothetical protein
VEWVAATTTAGPGTFTYQFSLNSLFDPNTTGTGHQPRGFDQIKTLYNRYRVYGVSYRVTGVLDSIPTNQATFLGVNPINGTNSSTTSDAAAESNWGAAVPISIYAPNSISGFVNLPQLNGKTPEAYMADDTTQADISASPSESMHLIVSVQNLAGTAVSAYIFVQLEYDCEFSDAINLAQS